MAGEETAVGEGGVVGYSEVMDGSGPRDVGGSAIPQVGRGRRPRGARRPVEEPVEQGRAEEGVEGRPRRITRVPRRFLE